MIILEYFVLNLSQQHKIEGFFLFFMNLASFWMGCQAGCNRTCHIIIMRFSFITQMQILVINILFWVWQVFQTICSEVIEEKLYHSCQMWLFIWQQLLQTLTLNTVHSINDDRLSEFCLWETPGDNWVHESDRVRSGHWTVVSTLNQSWPIRVKK